MSIKIHHGAPGSYKSSGAIHTDVIPAIKAGRYIITNVRGFSVERCREVLGKDVPEGFEVLYVETESQEGRDHLARFYHWAPKGAFFLVDEVQRVFPPAWRQSDLDRLDYPGGPDKAKEDGRPETIDVAFDMHRHHNWDFVLTTPNIKKVHQVIR
ncbi:zonular occludens toxin domain-containing protein, partial [Aeromonas caviae]|uniref:zonular occludens toxin domain-containing protein n=2 Tax=Aeromonadaceae TaxID=84642 RepID=UPI002B473014